MAPVNTRFKGKELFIVGGFNVHPADVERILFGHEDISQVAVVGEPYERLGEVGMAFVVPRTGTVLKPHRLVEWARERMANYKVPHYVEICDALPPDALGKIVKDELRERGRACAAPTATTDAGQIGGR